MEKDIQQSLKTLKKIQKTSSKTVDPRKHYIINSEEEKALKTIINLLEDLI
jgi:hypothetical protein